MTVDVGLVGLCALDVATGLSCEVDTH